MKVIHLRSSTSYSGASNIRAGIKSISSTIDEFCLASPVVLISIWMIITGILGGALAWSIILKTGMDYG